VIINISGTGGAGKSFLIRRIMELYDEKVPKIVYGRKQPLYYQFHRSGDLSGNNNSLFIPGHYETACGGCDTLAGFTPTLDYIYDLIRRGHDKTTDVVYEGMLVESDVRRAAELHADGFPFRVISIELPLAECLESINIRRRRKKPDAPDVKPKATRDRWKAVQRRIPRLRERGVTAGFFPREEAFMEIVKLLQLTGREANSRHL